MKKGVLAIALVLLLAACGQTSTVPSEKIVVRIGLMGSESKTWNYVKEQVAKDNIELELKFFDAYPLVNRALAEKELDLNAFQHYNYLNKEKAELGYDLTAIADTVYAPLGLYSKSIKNVSEAKAGDKVAIPDDVTNGGRALLLLQAAGLIEVRSEAGFTPSIKDITKKNVDIQIIEMAANLIPAALSDVAFAAINSGIATDAGLKPGEDSILLESVEGENPFVNVIVARTEDKDNEAYQKIIKAYQTDKVKELLSEETNGSSIPAWK